MLKFIDWPLFKKLYGCDILEHSGVHKEAIHSSDIHVSALLLSSLLCMF